MGYVSSLEGIFNLYGTCMEDTKNIYRWYNHPGKYSEYLTEFKSKILRSFKPFWGVVQFHIGKCSRVMHGWWQMKTDGAVGLFVPCRWSFYFSVIHVGGQSIHPTGGKFPTNLESTQTWSTYDICGPFSSHPTGASGPGDSHPGGIKQWHLEKMEDGNKIKLRMEEILHQLLW